MAESGGLDDFAAAQTAGADTNALRRPVDERAHGLQVGLEPSWSHVVGVGNRPADHRTLVADLAPLGHKPSCSSRKPAWTQAQTLNCIRFYGTISALAGLVGSFGPAACPLRT